MKIKMELQLAVLPLLVLATALNTASAYDYSGDGDFEFSTESYPDYNMMTEMETDNETVSMTSRPTEYTGTEEDTTINTESTVEEIIEAITETDTETSARDKVSTIISDTTELDDETTSAAGSPGHTVETTLLPTTQQSVEKSTVPTTFSPTTETQIETTTTSSPIIPDGFNWFVNDAATKVNCIMARMDIRITVKYTDAVNKSLSGTVVVPSTATASGSCSGSDQYLKLTWQESGSMNSVTLHFAEDGKKSTVDGIEAFIYLDAENFPNAKDPSVKVCNGSALGLFRAPLGTGRYVCDDEKSLLIDTVKFTFNDVKLIAYNRRADVSNRAEENCSVVKNANASVIVGCVIGTIIVAIVVAIGFYAWYTKPKPRPSELP